jgi:hypothetical protein
MLLYDEVDEGAGPVPDVCLARLEPDGNWQIV